MRTIDMLNCISCKVYYSMHNITIVAHAKLYSQAETYPMLQIAVHLTMHAY